jgi:hypothetical protein
LLHLPDGSEEADEQVAKIVQLAADTVPVVMQEIAGNLPEELKPPVLASYEDKNREIRWGYFPAAEVNKGLKK